MKIVELSRKEYQDYPIEYKYVTKFYYDVVIKKKSAITVTIKRKKFRRRQEKTFNEKLFEPYIEQPQSFAIFDKKKMIGVIEGSFESWNNRYRIHNLLVEQRYRRMGYGKALFEHVTEVAKSLGARMIIFETQSCNDPAIQFYFDQGLHFVGLDTMCYSNDDIEQKEVRLELGIRL